MRADDKILHFGPRIMVDVLGISGFSVTNEGKKGTSIYWKTFVLNHCLFVFRPLAFSTWHTAREADLAKGNLDFRKRHQN